MHKRRRIAVVAVVLALLVAIAFLNRSSIRQMLDVSFGNEYSQPSSETVDFIINSGDDGATIANKLVEAGITKSVSSTYKVILAKNPTFFPGVYKLHLKMKTSDVLAALQSGSSAVDNSVLIKEGTRASTIFKLLSEKYGTPLADFEAVKPSDLNLPSEALNLDGYLFPAKYQFDPKQSAISILKTMHNRMLEEIAKAGIKAADVHRVLTLAGLIQREGRFTKDFYKISRVFLNRIELGMPLQSDATVSYGAGSVSYTTTAAQRADDNPWNTYKHLGLPAGPISAPGAAAIDAALHPADGSWIFFCTVNLETGETEFSTTLAEHERSVAKWRAWMVANPGW
ncbi:MAG: hypothetical protein RL719_379 [Actinomycetota bacterium]